MADTQTGQRPLFGLEEIFGRMKKKYLEVFKLMYPSKNNTGFTERNLSVSFAESWKEIHSNSCVWYEYQFGEKNNLHYDAIILDYTNKVMIIVESKRFNAIKKIDSAISDLRRIEAVKTDFCKDFNARIRDFKDYSIQGVLLGDVWTESKFKQSVLDSFYNKTFPEAFAREANEPKTHLEGKEYYAIGFSDSIKDKWLIESPEKLPWIENHYYILGMTWLVK